MIRSISYDSYNSDGSAKTSSQTDYYEDGVTVSYTATTAYYSNGGSSYLEQSFAANGTKIEELTLINGEIDGPNTRWYSSGIKRSEEVYELGVLISKTNWDSSGRITGEELYELGVRTERTLWNYHPNGEIDTENYYDYSGGSTTRTIKSWHDNGTLATVARFIDSQLEGIQERYNEAGYLIQESFYLHSQLDGIQRTFDSLGLPATETNYQLGQRTGPYRQWHTGGIQLSLEGTCLNGKNDGTLKKWHPNGQLSGSEHYANGVPDKLHEAFNENGKPTGSTLYALGIIQERSSWGYHTNGETQSLYFTDYRAGVELHEQRNWNENGTLTYSSSTTNGGKGRLEKYFDEAGRPIREYTYRTGKRHGPYRLWHSGTDQLREEGSYLDGVYDGPWESWHLNGEPESEGDYENGIRIGDWVSYNDAGLQTNAETWIEGELCYLEQWTYQADGSWEPVEGETAPLVRFSHGISQTDTGDFSDYSTVPDQSITETYHNDGTPSSYREYERGQKEGVHRTYDLAGKIMTEIFYSQDLLHGRSRTFSPENNGALVSEKFYIFGKPTGESLEYDPATNTLLLRSQYSEGKLHGLHETFFADATPSLRAKYDKGLRNEGYKRWFSPGLQAEDSTYTKDVLDGPWKSYWGSDQLREEGEYADGLKTGTWTSYHSNGEMFERSQYTNGFLNGLFEEWDFRGDFTLRARYSGGILDGLWEENKPGSSPTATTYELGVEIGPRIWGFPNGRSTTTPLVNGRAHGLVAGFEDDEQGGVYLYSEINYENGRRNGSYKYYYPGGKTRYTGQYENGYQTGAYKEWILANWNTSSPGPYWLSKTGSYGGAGKCGIWTEFASNGEVQLGYPRDFGPCAPTPTPEALPLIRTLRGQITANGIGVPFATVILSGVGGVSNDKGNYVLPIRAEEGPESNLRVVHDDYPTKEVVVSIPAEDGVFTENVSFTGYPDSVIELGTPSVAGTFFLEGVSLPVTFPATVDWNGANRSTRSVNWIQGENDNKILSGTNSSTQAFTIKIDPGHDIAPGEDPGTLVAHLGSGAKSEPVVFPQDYTVVPNPKWAQDLGMWTVTKPQSPDQAATYSLSKKWPDPAINIGIQKENVDSFDWIIWGAIPVIGGEDLGVFDVQIIMDLLAKTDGTGRVKLGGGGRLNFGPLELEATVKGDGKLTWTDNELQFSNADVLMEGNAVLEVLENPLNLFRNYKIPESIWSAIRVFDIVQFEANLGLGFGYRFQLENKDGKISIPSSEVRYNVLYGSQLVFNGIKAKNFEASLDGKMTLILGVEGEDVSFKGIESTLKAKLKFVPFGIEVIDWERNIPDPPNILSTGDLQSTPQFFQPTFLELGFYSNYNQQNLSRMQSDRSGAGASMQLSETTAPLVSNIYPYANPAIAESNGQKVITYSHYDPERPEGQSTRLYYSVDSGTGFQEPKALHTQARADFDSQLSYLPDGRLIAIWETSQLDQIATDFEDRLAGLEIVWSVYDAVNDSWSEPVQLSNNIQLDHKPSISASPDGLMVLWHSNESNAIFSGPSTPDQLQFATWNGNTFDTSVSLPFTTPILGDASLAYDGTNAVVSWIQDIDEDFATFDDTEVFIAEFDGTNWSPARTITTDTTRDHSPRVFCLKNGSFEIIWSKNNQLVRMNDWTTLTHQVLLGSEDDSSAPQYDVTCNANGHIALLWTEYVEEKNDLFYALFDPQNGTWSERIALTDNENKEYVPTFALNNNGSLIVAYLSEATESEQRDLFTLSRDPGIDLTVGRPTFVPSIDSPGEYEITTEIMNLGNLSAGYVSVEFYLGDPDSGGTLLKTSNITMHGGHQSYVSFTSSGLQPDDDGLIFARIDPSDTIAETNEFNNTASSILTLRELDDDDGDGIPDAWEQTHFENLDEDGSGDWDKDGYSDLYEYLTLTDPNDAASNFRYSIEPDPSIPDHFLIQFQSINSRLYRIQWAANLSGWIDHSFNEGTGAMMSISVPGSLETDIARFFRIRIENE